MFSACCANEVRASVAPRLQGAVSIGYAPSFCQLDRRGWRAPHNSCCRRKAARVLFYFSYVDKTIDPRASARRSDCSTTCGSTSISSTTRAFLLKLGHRPWHDPYFHLIVLAAVFMAARTLAFPGEAYRAQPASYLLLALGL